MNAMEIDMESPTGRAQFITHGGHAVCLHNDRWDEIKATMKRIEARWTGEFAGRIDGQVSLTGRSYPDVSYMEAIRGEVEAMGPVPSREEILEITAKDPASWSDAIIAEREERF